MRALKLFRLNLGFRAKVQCMLGNKGFPKLGVLFGSPVNKDKRFGGLTWGPPQNGNCRIFGCLS